MGYNIAEWVLIHVGGFIAFWYAFDVIALIDTAWRKWRMKS